MSLHDPSQQKYVTFYNKLEVRLYEHDCERGKWHVNNPEVPLQPPVALLWRRVVCPINQRRPSTSPGGGLSIVMFVLVSPLCSKTLIKHCGDGERRDVWHAKSWCRPRRQGSDVCVHLKRGRSYCSVVVLLFVIFGFRTRRAHISVTWQC